MLTMLLEEKMGEVVHQLMEMSGVKTVMLLLSINFVTMKKGYFEISLVYKDEDAYKIEKIYAEKFNEFYRLKAIPAFANGLAYDDVISVECQDGQLFFDELIKSSGHSVVRIAVLNAEVSSFLFATLISFGVNINYLHNNLFLVIDVPPNVYYKKFRDFLIQETEHGNIEVDEGCISDIHYSTIAPPQAIRSVLQIINDCCPEFATPDFYFIKLPLKSTPL